MELKEFIGKVVYCPSTKRNYTVSQITAPEFKVQDINKNAYGTYSTYCYENQNGDPISRGLLEFVDPSLKEPFIEAFKKYDASEDARLERYTYWLFKSY